AHWRRFAGANGIQSGNHMNWQCSRHRQKTLLNMNLNPPELDLPQASSSVPDRAIGTRAVADCDALRVAHILRKCNPAEWGGTETAIQRIVSGLRKHNVKSVVYCPHLAERSTA